MSYMKMMSNDSTSSSLGAGGGWRVPRGELGAERVQEAGEDRVGTGKNWEKFCNKSHNVLQ